jgi:hypothetical protein
MDETDREEAGAERKKRAEEISNIVKGLKEWKGRYEGYAEELKQNGETRKSLTDPDSRLMLSNGKMDVCYRANGGGRETQADSGI